MRYRCAHCRESVSLPLKRHTASCPVCRRPMLVNPEKPFLNFWFLFALVMFGMPLAGNLWTHRWDMGDILSGSILLLVPAGIYFTMLYFSGTVRLYASKQEPRIEPAPGAMRTAPASQPEPATAPAPVAQAAARRGGGFIGWAVLGLLFGAYVAWVYVYIVMLRPRMEDWLAQYISAYPLMLNLVPLIGVPILLGWLVVGLVRLVRAATRTGSKAR